MIMKKLMLIAFSLVMMTFAANAQHVFEKGDIGINAGLGLGGHGGFFPAIEASVEFGVIPTGDVGLVSFGGAVGYKYSKYVYDSWWYDGDDYHYNQFTFGGRAAWHLHTFDSDKWDVYGGLGLGLRIWTDYTYDHDYWDDHNELKTTANTGTYTELFVGGRMMINPGFGLFAEIGYSALSYARFGLTFKM